MMASTYYPSVNIGSTFDEIYDALLEANDAANIGSTVIYSISGQVAQDCVDIEYGDFQCPTPEACCVDGACLEMSAQECERMGGQLVGNDCDDPDIICEGEDQAPVVLRVLVFRLASRSVKNAIKVPSTQTQTNASTSA